jgi:hypothetical protein
VIGFACAVSSQEQYRKWALPGIEKVRDPEDALIEVRDIDSVYRAYNTALERAAALEGLEALVLLHQDLELADPRLKEKIRRRMADPQVAILGTMGGRGVHSIGWWDCDEPYGCHEVRVPRAEGASGPAALADRLLEGSDYASDFGGDGELVDAVDGMLMVLSPWAVSNLRFDESLSDFHGYDADICFQARAAGKQVMVERMPSVHHHSTRILSSRQSWIEAHIAFARKWGL